MSSATRASVYDGESAPRMLEEKKKLWLLISAEKVYVRKPRTWVEEVSWYVSSATQGHESDFAAR